MRDPSTAHPLRDLAMRFAATGPFDVTVTDDALTSRSPVPTTVSLDDLAQALAPLHHHPTPVRLAALTRWWSTRTWCAQPLPLVRDTARVYAAHRDSTEPMGEGWAREPVPGHLLVLGIAVVGALPHAPSAPVPVPTSVWEHLNLDPRPWWPRLRHHHEQMGERAAHLLAARTGGGPRTLRTVAGCDVPSLAAAATLRTYLADSSDLGLAHLAATGRDHALIYPGRTDLAFAAAVADPTAALDPIGLPGFPGLALVTRHEVVAATTSTWDIAQAVRGR